MKRILIATTALTLATAAYAQSSDFVDRVAADLAAQGYENIEVETENGTVVAEGEMNGVSYEFTYDPTTEALLSREEEVEDSDDDDDTEEAEDEKDTEEADDEDEDDEDEDDDDDEEDEDDDEDEDA